MANVREYTLDLSPQSAEQIAKMIESYIKELDTKRRLLIEQLAQLGLPIIEQNAAAAQEPIDNYSTNIVIVDSGNTTTAKLILEGNEVLFVEFGAGIHFNGSSSPNPYSAKFGYEIGGYGKHQGLNDFWFYREDGELIKSHGTKATMPMYRAYEEICNNFIRIAESVFM